MTYLEIFRSTSKAYLNVFVTFASAVSLLADPSVNTSTARFFYFRRTVKTEVRQGPIEDI